MKKKCGDCGKELDEGDKVVRTYTIEKYNFSQNDWDSFASGEDDLSLFLCVDCCENMNFRSLE